MDTGRPVNGISHVDQRKMTANLVVAYVSFNRVPASDMPALIATISAALTSLHPSDTSTTHGDKKATPAQIRASIQHEALISFEDGRPHKILKRHLTAYGLTPETYRAKWGLPIDYPMVAPAYAAKRSRIAKGVMMNRYPSDLTPEAAAA